MQVFVIIINIRGDLMSEYINTSDERVKRLDQYLTRLVNKDSLREAYDEAKDAIDEVTPFDVLRLTRFQTDSDMSIDEIKEVADRIVNVFHIPLSEFPWGKHEHHQFFKVILEEHRAIESKLDGMKSIFKERDLIKNKEILQTRFSELDEMKKHFVKMQNIFFPKLEKRELALMPLQVMWSVHDDARKSLKNILLYLEDVEEKEHDLLLEIGEFYYLVYGLLQKQELILYPVASYLLDEVDFDEMYNECLEIGYAYMKTPTDKIQVQKETEVEVDEDVLYSSFTGSLTKEQLQLTLDNIPIDITYVDEHDKVVFFNNAKDRFFPRSPSIVGRAVDKCHPPESVHVVNEIVEAFKEGRKDKASFWLQMKGKFIVINYYALRNEQGKYKGVLEVSQDVSEIRSLEGQRKILDWEE